MSKKVIAIVILICLILLILPVRSYAAAAGAGLIIGGTAYAAGTYTFGTLPPVVQGIMNSAAEDYQNQLFPSKSNIILLDPNFSSGGGNNNNNKQPLKPDNLTALVMYLMANAVYEISEAGDDIYKFSVDHLNPIIEDAFSGYVPSDSEIELAEDIIQKGVDRVNETEFGNKPLTVEEFTEKSGYDYNAFLNDHGLVDKGTDIFDRLKNQYGFDEVYSMRYDQFNFTDGYINNKPAIVYFVTPNSDVSKLQLLFGANCYNSNPTVRYFYESSNDSIRYCTVNNPSYFYHRYSGYHAEIIYCFIFTGSTPQEVDSKSTSFRSDLQSNKVSIVDGDLVSVPGVNPNNLTDVEKAALGLASHLGVDVGVIGSQFQLVVDENGDKYMEQIATGTRYSVDEFMNVFNEINAGNTAIINNLQKLLDQLKSQDISGIENIVSQIQSNIDDLNNRDKNREAVYSNITETLSQVKTQLEKNYIDPEIINDINSNIEAISSVISPLSDPIQIDEDKLKAPATITTKFPFSLPFDIYHIFNVFSADPVTPEFDVPIDMTTVGGDVYNVHIDLSQFDFIAEIVRWLLYAVFIAGLIILTNRLIGRG